MSRCAPFRRAPPPVVAAHIAEARVARFLVVAEPGPTKFVLRAAPPTGPVAVGQRVRLTRPLRLDGAELPSGATGVVSAAAGSVEGTVEVEFADFLADVPAADLEARGSERKHTVEVGSLQRCSCTPRGDELCLHIVWVMLRVYGVPGEDEMVWQRGLTDAEVGRLLHLRALRRELRSLRRLAADAGAAAPGAAAVRVERREVSDTCPICYEDMDMAASPGAEGCLTWCRLGCGNNIHVSCMRAWAQHNKERVTCPYCRGDWPLPVRPATPPPGAAPPPAAPLTLQDGGGAGWRDDAGARAARRRRSAPAPRPAAHDAACRHCGADPITGALFRCGVCVSFDLCAGCVRDPLLHAMHPFLTVPRPGGAAHPCDRGALGGEGGLVGVSFGGGAPAAARRPAGGGGSGGYAGGAAAPDAVGGGACPIAFSVSGTRRLSQRRRTRGSGTRSCEHPACYGRYVLSTLAARRGVPFGRGGGGCFSATQSDHAPSACLRADPPPPHARPRPAHPACPHRPCGTWRHGRRSPLTFHTPIPKEAE